MELLVFKLGSTGTSDIGNSTLLKGSQSFKPIEDRAVVAPLGSALSAYRFDLGQSFALHLQVDCGVLVCGVGAGMTKPLTNSRQVHSGFQQSNRGAVAEAVRMKSLASEARNVGLGAILILPQQIADTEPSEWLASVI